MKDLIKFSMMFLCVSCASGQTRLTDDEVKALEKKFPDTFSALKDSSLNTSLTAAPCNDKGECYQIDCRGRGELLKCWRSPISLEEAKIVNGGKQLSDEEIISAKQTCLNSERSLSSCKRGCLIYLHSSDKVYFHDVMLSFCNIRGVSCKKDGVPWGKNTFVSGSDKVHADSIVDEEDAKEVRWSYMVDEAYSH